jgi:hypothetical protein
MAIRTSGSDAESSARRRIAQSLGAHVLILQAMLNRMRLERETFPADAIADRVLLDIRIRNVERDIRLVRLRLLGNDH